MPHTLRVYKHGSDTYSEVTDSMPGGFTVVTRTAVRNEPGALVFDLEATTVAMLHAWLDEAARVELWEDATRVGIYEVDSYAPRWKALACRVNCAGILVAGKGVPYTGTFTNAALVDVLQTLVAAVPGWTWSAGLVNVSGTVTDFAPDRDKVLTAIATLGQLFGFDYWIDGDGAFNAATWPTVSSKTLTLNENCFACDPSYSAVDVVNQLVLISNSGIWTFNEPTSQAAYGIRSQEVSVAGIVTRAVAEVWAESVFASLAYPIQPMVVEAAHDDAHIPGMLVTLEGLEDGRTYLDIVTQVAWTLGDLTDKLNIGHQPPAIHPPETLVGNSTDKEGPTPEMIEVTASVLGEAVVGEVTASMDPQEGEEVVGAAVRLFLEQGGPVFTAVQASTVFDYPDTTSASFNIALPESGTDLYRIRARAEFTYYNPTTGATRWVRRYVHALSNIVEATNTGLTAPSNGLPDPPAGNAFLVYLDGTAQWYDWWPPVALGDLPGYAPGKFLYSGDGGTDVIRWKYP